MLSEATANFNGLTKSKKVIFTNMKTGEILTFNSYREPSSSLNVSRNTINKYIDTSLLYKKIYKISSAAFAPEG